MYIYHIFLFFLFRYNDYNDQKSGEMRLESGAKYYMEAVMREKTGADHLSIGVYLPDGKSFLPITNHYLEEYY